MFLLLCGWVVLAVFGGEVLPGLFLSSRAFEPVVVMRRAQARIRAGDETLIVHLCAEIARVDVGDHFPRVSGCAQKLTDKFILSDRFRTGNFDLPFTGSPTATSVRAAATSSAAMGCIRPGDNRTICPSVADCAMPFTNSKNCVERTIVNGILDALIRFS